MQLLEAYQFLVQKGRTVITTRDAALLLKITPTTASQMLLRMEKKGLLCTLKKGLWAFIADLDPYYLAEELVAPFPSYLSCQTALYLHNMIDQIPSIIYSVTPARTKVYQTPLGTFSFHHIHPNFFLGFEQMGKQNIKVATPEKALIDFFYLSNTKTHLFGALPELELPEQFSWERAQAMIEKIPNKKLKTMVQKNIEKY